MNDNEGVHILSDYVSGCGGVLCAGWHARPHWSLISIACVESGIRPKFTFTPPKDFRPVAGQQRQKQYLSLKQVALAMGLEPDRGLAARVTATACAENNTDFVSECARRPLTGASSSSPGPEDTAARRKRPAHLTAAPQNDCEAVPGPEKVSKHGAFVFPTRAAQVPKSDPRFGYASFHKQEQGRDGPLQVPHTQPSMRSSHRRSSLNVQPNVNTNNFAEQGEQHYMAMAGRSAAKSGKPGSKRPNLPRASGMQHRLNGRLSDEEVERLQHENRKLKQQVATLELKVKGQQLQQGAREEEMRALQLAHTRTVNHLFSDIHRLEQQSATNSQAN